LAELERLQFSCELHDTLMQYLIAARYAVEGMRRRQEQHPPGREEMEELEAMLTQAIQEGRAWIGRLRGDRLPGIESLGERLKAWVEQQRKAHPDTTWGLSLPPAQDCARVDSFRARMMVRIAEEATRNSLRHGHAASIDIALTIGAEDWRLVITDDGSGFDPSNIPEDHYGIRSMRTRAAMMGGTLSITSGQSQGTRVEAIIPAPGPASHLACLFVVQPK
jgi:signal transduction histidine kinase